MTKHTEHTSIINITDFFREQFVDYGSYGNIRMISSYIDGQKNSTRKVLYTVLEKNIKENIKVSQLASKVAEFTEYLHADVSNVISNMTASYTGSNNMPFLQGKGNFGTRFNPVASAPRYIYSKGNKQAFELFKKVDDEILVHQTFEGQKIEPLFYVPVLPMIMINGADGIGVGFSQKILPRNPKSIKKYVENLIQGKKNMKKYLVPYYEGFKGVIEEGEKENQWVIKGIAEKKNTSTILITELPIGWNLTSYVKKLNDLEDKKIITSYKDMSEDDQFKFEVKVPRKDLEAWDHETMLEKLGLVKRVSEILTAINEQNKIEVFYSIEDIIKKYVDIKIKYIGKRKIKMLENLEADIKFSESKRNFIKNIVEGKLKIMKRKKSAIIQDIEKIDGCVQKMGSWDYLLNMNISSLTKENMDKMTESIKSMKNEIKTLEKTSEKDMWLSDLSEIKV